ncbi:D-glucuronyl C5-epimerase family protein [Brachybacterium sp. GCM10030267]|uniref:D-glucuronyl C5-epimerase family protein n=1 Tax=Brachybacterium sp. GCM10030267 TaxID=3273381 RepID=UPI00361EDAC1
MTAEVEYITNEAEVGLPPLQASRRTVWNYYRIEFLRNGYPGRRTGDVLYAHPIYGPYVIADYIAQYRRTKDDVFLDAAKRVADAAVEQMTPLGDGLAFLYNPKSTAVSTRGGTFYSGLTQSRYIEGFRNLVTLPGTERFKAPLLAIVRSLLIPAEEGGVARTTDDDGLIIEEYPSQAPDCTLNGWTTATCILRDYARSTQSDEGWDIFHRSVRGLERLIPVYDVPELANSRYRLTGVASIQAKAVGADLEITDCRVHMPGSGVYKANVAGDPAGEALKAGPRKISDGAAETLVLSLSRLTWPAPNKVLLSVRASGSGAVSLGIGDGPYSPMTKNLPVEYFRELGTFPVDEGENEIELAVPWTDAELVAYPTGFGKAIADRQFNQYHWIHVDTLGKIVEETGSDLLAYYRDKWRQYPSRWTDLSEYADSRITLERFDPKRHK